MRCNDSVLRGDQKMGKKIVYFITNKDKTGLELALENKEDEKTICLLQNAVYFANKSVKETSSAINQGIKVIACKEDINIRGLNKYIFDKVELKDYGEIIDIVLANDAILNI